MQPNEFDSQSMVPTAISVPPSSPSSGMAMASFGIAEDPDAESRKLRGKVFGVGMAVVLGIAAIMLARSPAEAAPKPKEEKPAAAAAAPPPPAASAAAPAASAPPPAPAKEEAKPDAGSPKDEKPSKHGKKRGKKHAE